MIGTEPLEFSAIPFKKPHVVMAIISETPDGYSLVLCVSWDCELHQELTHQRFEYKFI